MTYLSEEEQIFMMRLYKWRIEEAQIKKNYSKEMILSSKYINLIVRNIKQGEAALRNNRLLPKNFYTKYGKKIKALFDQPVQPFERAVLNRLPQRDEVAPLEDITHDILYALIKRKSLLEGVSQNLIFSKSSLKNFKEYPNWLNNSWRAQVLGKELVSLCKKIESLEFKIEDGSFKLQ